MEEREREREREVLLDGSTLGGGNARGGVNGMLAAFW